MSLGQFYTPMEASDWLVSGVGLPDPAQVFDIGAGEGELLLAARRRWGSVHLLAADIDPANVVLARGRLPRAKCYQADALRHDLPSLLGVEEGSLDVALGNPPYGAVSATQELLAILRDAGLADAVSPKRLTRDIVFLAQNLRLLKPGGELAVIVPEGLAVNRVYADLRSALMERHGLSRVIELPEKLFRGTEARTMALFLKKDIRSERVLLESAGGMSIHVNTDLARQRLDARFHGQMPPSGLVLADLKPEILRGALTHADAQWLGVQVFHTTTFKHFSTGRVRMGRLPDLPERWQVKHGDILVPRVGSRCLSHAAIVDRGRAIYTDCVFRVRVSAKWRGIVLRSLRSVGGVMYRLTAAHGTCAAVLSKENLLHLPIE